MKRLALLPFLLAALATPALAQSSVAPATIDERIDQGLDASILPANPLAPQSLGAPPVTDTPMVLGVPPKRDGEDMSLTVPTGPNRLRTTLEPIDIEQRIDKGLTAAGEQSSFPPDLAFGAFQRGWFLTAFSLALDRAKGGDPKAQTLLGVLLSRGLGVKPDIAAAADWFSLAGKSGDAEALYALGQLYLEGQGVKTDQVTAADLFRQAADENHAGAARELGYLLLQGKGEEKNAMLAGAYLRRAAGLGDMDAQYTLAGLYVEGVGVVADATLAARWFSEAARNGHTGAQVEYGIILFNGTGVAKDEAAAAFWFARAADTDNPAAQLRLARLLAEGRGVDADPAEAARWYLIAKDHGLDDDFMEDWMRRLDPEARAAARSAADTWSRLGPQQAAVSTEPEPAPVDKQVE